MWGKMDGQVEHLFNKAINDIGESRHQAKQFARDSGALTHNAMAKETGVYSYGTSNTYVPIWKSFANWAKENRGMKDLENVSNRAVKEFLQVKRHDCNKYSSFSKICSAMTKLETALNKYAENEGSEKSYNFQKVIDTQRSVAMKLVESGKMEKGGGSRGFADRNAVTEQVKNPTHQFVAEVQAQTGCRVSEVAVIKEGQLRGVGKDPYNGKEAGVVEVKGKGGKLREVYLKPETYRELENRIKEGNGVMKVGKSSFTTSIKGAAYLADQRYTGTHDFRHAWVQDRFNELAQLGYSDEQCLAAVSLEIGHVRPDITEVYLK